MLFTSATALLAALSKAETDGELAEKIKTTGRQKILSLDKRLGASAGRNDIPRDGW